MKALRIGAVVLIVAAGCASPPPPRSAQRSSSAQTVSSSPCSEGSDSHVGQRGVSYLTPEPSEGGFQSPINIVTSRAVPGQHEVAFHYRSSKEHLENLGHTIQVVYDTGSSLEFDGTTYDLVTFHFHTPSEHLLDGVTFPMEMHLVHRAHENSERYLVVGVLFKEGASNLLLDTLLADVPRRAGESVDHDVLLDASSLLEPGEGYFHYDGSLTTPPYTEAVTWLVLDRVHDASAEQIEVLNRLEGDNARHIQDQRARLVDHGR